MAAISFSVKRGVQGFAISDYTIGTLAPNANDIELRYNTTDTNGKKLTREDVVLALKALERALLTGGTTVDYTLDPSGPPS